MTGRRFRPGILAGGCCVAIIAAGCGASHGGASQGGASHGGGSPAGSTSPAGGSRPAGASRPAAAPHLPAAQRRALAAQYLAIAEPANHSLDVANNGYRDREHAVLAGARTELLNEIAAERLFDAQLLAITFPAAIEDQVKALVVANNARIRLTQRQAQAATLASLRALDRQHRAADATVEAPVRQIRRGLGLPPPATS